MFFSPRLRCERGDRLVHDRLDVHVHALDLRDAGLDPADVQHVVHEQRQTFGLALDHGVELVARFLVRGVAVEQHLDDAADRSQRRPELVARLVDEVGLHLRELALARQIVDDGDDTGHVLLVARHAGERDLEDRRRPAVGILDLELDAPTLARVAVLAHVGDELHELVVRDGLLDGLVRHVVQVEAEQPGRGLVRHDDLIECVGDDDGVAQSVEHCLELPAFRLGHTVPDLDLAELVAEMLLALVELIHRGGQCPRYGEQPARTAELLGTVGLAGVLDVLEQVIQ